MSNLFAKLNKKTKLFNVDVENPQFRKLNDFEAETNLCVIGCYINKKSNFGDSPVFIVHDETDEIYFVNVPKSHINTINEIINNEEMVEAINNYQCWIKVISYFNKRFNKLCFDIEFIESPIQNDEPATNENKNF